MSRYIDRLPMTIKFAAIILEKFPDANDHKIVDRAHKIAGLISEKCQSDPCPNPNETRHKPHVVRVKTARDRVENMWTNSISNPNGR